MSALLVVFSAFMCDMVIRASLGAAKGNAMNEGLGTDWDETSATIELRDYSNEPNVEIRVDYPKDAKAKDSAFIVKVADEIVLEILQDGTTTSCWAREWRPWRRRTASQRIANEFVRAVTRVMQQAAPTWQPVEDASEAITEEPE